MPFPTSSPSSAPAPGAAPAVSAQPVCRPSWAFMRRHPARVLALGLGAGLARFGPGTVGTLWAWASFLLLNPVLGPAAWGAVLVLGFFIGWWACTRTAQHLGVTDPGCIVWDEILAFWLVLLFIMPAGFWAQALAFVLFRFFDAAKPQPVRWADQAFKGQGWRGGFGILFDDLVAAFCTLLVLALLRAGGGLWL